MNFPDQQRFSRGDNLNPGRFAFLTLLLSVMGLTLGGTLIAKLPLNDGSIGR